MYNFRLILIWLILLSHTALLAQNVYITQDTTWTSVGNPHMIGVFDTLKIDSGVTLTLAPGTEVLLSGPIENRGVFDAQGQLNDSVRINGFGDIFIDDGYEPTFNLDYAEWIGDIDFRSPSLSLNALDMSFSISNSSAGGIVISEMANPKISLHKSDVQFLRALYVSSEGFFDIDSSTFSLILGSLGFNNMVDIMIRNSSFSMEIQGLEDLQTLSISNCVLDGVIIQGLTAQQNAATISDCEIRPTASVNSTLEGLNNITFERCIFNDVSVGYFSSSYSFSDCDFTDCQVRMDLSSIINFDECTFSNTPLEVTGSSDFNISRSVFQGEPGLVGVHFKNGNFGQASIDHTTFEGYDVVIKMDQANPNGVFDFRSNYFCNNILNVELAQPVADLSMDNNCFCQPDSASIAATISSPSPVDFLPLQFGCYANQIFPGDTDKDRIAGAGDLLGIGVNYGATGPARPNSSLDWIGQKGSDWGSTQSNGVDFKHIDTNGDGIINADDTLAIVQNYGRITEALKTAASGADLLLGDLQVDPNDANMYLLPILWGSADTTLLDKYGISFNISLDLGLGFGDEFFLTLEQNWLGDPGSDLLSIQYQDPVEDFLGAGMVRFDQMGRSGSGQIATLHLEKDGDVALEDLVGRIILEKVRAVNSSGDPVEIGGDELSFQATSLADISRLDIHLIDHKQEKLWELQDNALLDEVTIIDLTGKTIWRQEAPISSLRFSYSQLPSGIYTLGARRGNQRFYQKLLVD